MNDALCIRACSTKTHPRAAALGALQWAWRGSRHRDTRPAPAAGGSSVRRTRSKPVPRKERHETWLVQTTVPPLRSSTQPVCLGVSSVLLRNLKVPASKEARCFSFSEEVCAFKDTFENASKSKKVFSGTRTLPDHLKNGEQI